MPVGLVDLEVLSSRTLLWVAKLPMAASNNSKVGKWILDLLVANPVLSQRLPFGKCQTLFRSTLGFLTHRWTLVLSHIGLTKSRMGELEPWIDENFVKSVWFNMGEHVSVKMIRDKFSG